MNNPLINLALYGSLSFLSLSLLKAKLLIPYQQEKHLQELRNITESYIQEMNIANAMKEIQLQELKDENEVLGRAGKRGGVVSWVKGWFFK